MYHLNDSLHAQAAAILEARPKKMQGVRDLLDEKLTLATALPYLNITASDNLMSTVYVKGSYDARETWSNGIWENSRNFRFTVSSAGKKRYYDPAIEPNVVVELSQHGLKREEYKKFRRYTGSPEKVAAKIAEWIEANKNVRNLLA